MLMVRSKTNFYPFPLHKMFKALQPIRCSAWFRCAKYSKGTEIVSLRYNPYFQFVYLPIRNKSTREIVNMVTKKCSHEP